MRRLSGFTAMGRGARGGTQSQAIGKSRGGLTTKILALTDALGNLIRFVLLPGQRHDTVGVATLISGIAFGGLIGDKAFDANWLIAELNQRRTRIVISQMPQRKEPLAIDREVYKWRHLIENFFGKLKEFKRISMRSDKTDTTVNRRLVGTKITTMAKEAGGILSGDGVKSGTERVLECLDRTGGDAAQV
jgi:transposase